DIRTTNFSTLNFSVIRLGKTKRAMNLLRKCPPFKSLAGLFIIIALGSAAHADTVRTQTISLHKGWNAVFLQVTPAILDPAVVFSNTPVAIAAIHLPMETPVEFIQNPGAIQWKKDGWGVWYSPNRPDGFLSSLHAMNGNRSYLLYASQDYTWQVTGAVTFEPTRWKSSSFNLVGFGVSSQSPPTFDKFFAGSTAHQPYRIYRLMDGLWTQVSDPIRTTMRSGEACWIYCKGGSDYQGPLRVKLSAGQGVSFTDAGETGLAIANESNDPLGVQVQTVSNDAGLPLAYLIRGITQARIDQIAFDLPQTYQLPSLDPGQSTGFWLKLRREQMTNPTQATLLKISADVGVETWIPVTGTRTDLPATP
ncbi:MAG: hypothetical protein JWR69_4274, partial [Pedosphaera sp.]|nr:hypothetical protein [Pedosphaera sp.]